MAKRVVILGAGYGGVRCALTLQNESKQNETGIFVVDKNNYHQFVTQLQESATGLSDDGNVRVPLNEIFDANQLRIINDEVIKIVPQNNMIILKEGSLKYDYLAVGLGSEPEHFDIPGLAQYSLNLRSLNSAKMVKTLIQNNLIRFKDKPVERELLTIVIGGAGFIGVEITNELANWLPVLAEKYDIPENLINIISVEASSTILTGFDRQLIENAYRTLQEKGVRIITDVSIEGVTENEVRLTNGEIIRTRAFLWAGGLRANRVTAQAGFTAAVRGRAKVNKYLQSIDFPNVYIIGDNAFITSPDTEEIMAPTPQLAIQTGYIAARNILAEIRGQNPEVMHPGELGKVILFGRYSAVGKSGTRYKPKRRVGGVLKEAIQWKYLYSIGGFRLVAKKFLK